MRIDRSHEPATLVNDRDDQEVIPPGDLRHSLLVSIDGHTDHMSVGDKLDRQVACHSEQLWDGHNVQQPVIVVNDIDHRQMCSALIRGQPFDGFGDRNVLTDSDESTRHDSPC